MTTQYLVTFGTTLDDLPIFLTSDLGYARWVAEAARADGYDHPDVREAWEKSGLGDKAQPLDCCTIWTFGERGTPVRSTTISDRGVKTHPPDTTPAATEAA